MNLRLSRKLSLRLSSRPIFEVRIRPASFTSAASDRGLLAFHDDEHNALLFHLLGQTCMVRMVVCVTSRCLTSWSCTSLLLRTLWNSGIVSGQPASSKGRGGGLVDKAVLRRLKRESAIFHSVSGNKRNAIGAPMTEMIDQHIHLTIRIILGMLLMSWSEETRMATMLPLFPNYLAVTLRPRALTS